MSVFSGSSLADPNGRRLVDAIVRSAVIDGVRNVVGEISAPRIGEIRFVANAGRAVQGNILSMSDVPDGFDGWIYANGSRIAESLFPEAVGLFKAIEYSGKDYSGGSITVPRITKMFRLDAGGEDPYSERESKYSMPDHVHSIGEPTASQTSQTVKRCAFIWSTSVDTTSAGGKMPAVAESDFQYGGVTFPGGIPASPSAHKGSSSVKAYAAWDVPIDSSYVTGEAELKCQTGPTGSKTPWCEPEHVVMPVLIYIGKAG